MTDFLQVVGIIGKSSDGSTDIRIQIYFQCFFSLFSLFCKNELILLSSLNFKFLCSCSILITMQVCGHFMLYRSGHAQIPVLLTKFSNFKKLQLELYLVLPIMHIYRTFV